jgi:hypothetical protein
MSSEELKQLALSHLEYLASILPPGVGAYTSVGVIRRYILDSTPGESETSEDPTPRPGH